MNAIRYSFVAITLSLICSCSKTSSTPPTEELITRKIEIKQQQSLDLLAHFGAKSSTIQHKDNKFQSRDLTPSELSRLEDEKTLMFKTWFEGSGISFNKNHSLHYDERSEALIITQTPSSVHKIERLLIAFISNRPHKIHVTFKIIQTPMSVADEISRNLTSHSRLELDQESIKLLKQSIRDGSSIVLSELSGSTLNQESIELSKIHYPTDPHTPLSSEHGMKFYCKPSIDFIEARGSIVYSISFIENIKLSQEQKAHPQIVNLDFTSCCLFECDKPVLLMQSGPYSVGEDSEYTLLGIFNAEPELSTPL
jgi:hypothetical protein